MLLYRGHFQEQLARAHATITGLTPSALGTLSVSQLRGLRLVMVGGEGLPPPLGRTWATYLAEHAGCLLNVYGPTEATIWATAWPIAPRDERMSIGDPLPNYTCLVLNAQKRTPVPVGEPGELYIGGVGLARGYLGRAELTAQKYTAWDLPPTYGGGRVYATGDLASVTAQHIIMHHGRIDSQVKLRGYRIEVRRRHSCRPCRLCCHQRAIPAQLQ